MGRDEEARRIQRLIGNKVSVILVGPTGIGKSFLLESLHYPGKVLEIDNVSEFRKSIASALVHLLGSREAVADLLYKTTDADAVWARVSKKSLPSLCRLGNDCCDRKEYVLLINNIDRITPTVVKVLGELKDHFAWSFEKVELKPLSRPDALKMIYRLISDVSVIDLDAVMTKLYETSDGNPRKIRELCERLRREPFINLDTAVDGLATKHWTNF